MCQDPVLSSVCVCTHVRARMRVHVSLTPNLGHTAGVLAPVFCRSVAIAGAGKDGGSSSFTVLPPRTHKTQACSALHGVTPHRPGAVLELVSNHT